MGARHSAQQAKTKYSKRGEDIGPPTMDVNLMCKDMRAMIAEAKSLGRDLPVTERALNMFDKAAANGMGERIRDGIVCARRI